MTNGYELNAEFLLSERDWLTRLARRLTSDSELASDIEQETWLRALRKPVKVQSPRAWLASIARNVLVERRRSESRRTERERIVAPLESGDEDSLRRATLRRDIIDELLLLDEPDRSAVTLRYLEQRSYSEVAAALEITESAARKRVSRGIESLRRSLDANNGGREAWVALALPWTGWAVPRSASAAVTAAGSKGLFSGVPALGASVKVAAWVVAALLMGLLGQWWLGAHGDPVPVEPEVALDRSAQVSTQGSLAEVEEEAERLALVSPTQVAEAIRPISAAVPAFSDRPASTLGALALRVVWSDGQPASGVNVSIYSWGDPTPVDRQMIVRTDGAGQALVDGLSAGRVNASVDRGGSGVAEVLAGRVTSLEVTVPEGSRVSGIVRGPTGKPVAGAAVLLSGYFSAGHGKVVATTDGRGRYELRDVHNAHYIAARAEGFSPGCYEMLDGMATGSTYERDLVLRSGGGTVAGQVVDGAGTPVSGALIRIEIEGERQQSGASEDAFAIVLLSDSEGRFEARDAGAKTVEVSVRTEAYQDARVVVDPSDEGAQDLRIVLVVGAELAGTVTGADGQPAIGASVSVRESKGIYGFVRRSCTTDAQGRYRLRGLAPGMKEAFAYRVGAGEASKSVLARRSEVAAWNPKLIAGRSTAGSVVDESGRPLAGWMVGTQTGQMLWDRQSTTDEDGSFDISDLRDDATELHVTTPDGWLVGTLLTAEIVEPETLIVVPDSVRPTASVSLRVLSQGRPMDPPPEIQLEQLNGGRVTAFADGQGEVELTGIVPGEFRLTVVREGFADARRTGKLAPQASLEMGTIELVRGGRVRLELSRPAKVTELSLSEHAAVMRRDGTSAGSFELANGVGESEPLEPGNYVLLTYGALGLEGPRSVTVTDGEVTTLAEEAKGVGQARIRVTAEDPTALRGAIVGTVSLSNGASATVREVMTPDESGGCWLRFISLPAGPASVEVTASGGLVGSATFQVDPSTKEGRLVNEVVEMSPGRRGR